MKKFFKLEKEIVTTLNNIDIDTSYDFLKNYLDKNNNSKKSTELVNEFNEIMSDILNNPNVLALQNHHQHYTTSRYTHCLEVSFYTYLICKKFNLDYISAARGAMLHDFYFYNWHNKNVEGQKKFHAFRHPRISLANAMELFKLNDLEKDYSDYVRRETGVNVSCMDISTDASIPGRYVYIYIELDIDQTAGYKEFDPPASMSVEDYIYRYMNVEDWNLDDPELPHSYSEFWKDKYNDF